MYDPNLDKTLLDKTLFKQHASGHGVIIFGYRGDSGRFADKGFRDALDEADQTITFCSVGAHHQNTVAPLDVE